MKKALAIGSVISVFFYCALVAVAVMSPLNPYGKGKWLPPPDDFSMRMTEIDCLLRGVNPYDVWHGDVVLKPYVPNHGAPRRAVEGKEGFADYINAYAPWEYIMMMPFAFLPRAASWVLYFLLMMAGLGVLFGVGQSLGMAVSGGDREIGMIVGAVPFLLASLPMYQNFHAGNLAVPVLVAAVLMAICLNRGHDTIAGVCWSVAMIKPQLGLVFAIPLLMRRKFQTCFTAASICLLLTFIASFICHASPVSLILQTPAANTFVFNGCGTWPFFMCGLLPVNLDIVVGVTIGAVLCVWMTSMLARAGVRDWVALLMPAAVIGTGWTYAQCYSFTMNWFFFVVLCASLAKWPRSKVLWVVAVVSVVFMTRVYNLVHILPKVLPGVVPQFLPAESWHYHIDSLLTSVGLVLTVTFCWWLARKVIRQ